MVRNDQERPSVGREDLVGRSLSKGGMMQKHMLAMFVVFMSLNVAPAVYTETLLQAPTQRAVAAEHDTLPPFVGDRFARTELYFGTARPDNKPPVSEAEFQGFLD